MFVLYILYVCNHKNAGLKPYWGSSFRGKWAAQYYMFCNPGGQLKYYWQCWGASCVDGQLWVLMSAELEAFHVELTSKETCRHGFHLSALAGHTIPWGGGRATSVERAIIFIVGFISPS